MASWRRPLDTHEKSLQPGLGLSLPHLLDARLAPPPRRARHPTVPCNRPAPLLPRSFSSLTLLSGVHDGRTLSLQTGPKASRGEPELAPSALQRSASERMIG